MFKTFPSNPWGHMCVVPPKRKFKNKSLFSIQRGQHNDGAKIFVDGFEKPKKRVTFKEKPTIHVLRVWAFAYEEARKPYVEESFNTDVLQLYRLNYNGYFKD